MHYKNGRPAKEGDKIINLESGFTGVLHTTNAGSQTCNGRLAQTSHNDPWVTIGECLHIDDIKAAEIPDSSEK
jgi:hypothetical protein